MPANPDEPAASTTRDIGAAIPMPRLSDDAVVQIHHFIEHFLDLFEARCGDQIHRYDDDRSVHNMVDPDPTRSIDDPPF